MMTGKTGSTAPLSRNGLYARIRGGATWGACEDQSVNWPDDLNTVTFFENYRVLDCGAVWSGLAEC